MQVNSLQSRIDVIEAQLRGIREELSKLVPKQAKPILLIKARDKKILDQVRNNAENIQERFEDYKLLILRSSITERIELEVLNVRDAEEVDIEELKQRLDKYNLID